MAFFSGLKAAYESIGSEITRTFDSSKDEGKSTEPGQTSELPPSTETADLAPEEVLVYRFCWTMVEDKCVLCHSRQYMALPEEEERGRILLKTVGVHGNSKILNQKAGLQVQNSSPHSMVGPQQQLTPIRKELEMWRVRLP